MQNNAPRRALVPGVTFLRGWREAGRCSDGCSPKGQEVSVVAARFGLSFMFVPLGSGKYILLCKRSRSSAEYTRSLMEIT